MYQKIAKEILNRKKVKLSVILNGKNQGKQMVFQNRNELLMKDAGIEEESVIFQEAQKQAVTGLSSCLETEIFTEILTEEPQLVILGGGHVAAALCHMASLTGFHVTILEDRPDMARKERFPDADAIICQSFEDLSSVLKEQGENSFYVIVTRGHQSDQICLEQVLRYEYTYLGVIGSRQKTAHCRKLLQEHGFRNAEIASIHMPIGLNIGAQSPEEIAISILAEMIQEKNRRQSEGLTPEIWEWIAAHPGERAVLCTIIEKRGSAPRGVGSRMLYRKAASKQLITETARNGQAVAESTGDEQVLAENTGNEQAFFERKAANGEKPMKTNEQIIGTIGGGALEYAVIKEAARLKKDELKLAWFHLSSAEGAQLGMVCGGTVRVLMQEISC